MTLDRKNSYNIAINNANGINSDLKGNFSMLFEVNHLINKAFSGVTIMIDQNSLAADMLNDKEQMINYFSLEISELLCDYPSEMEIEEVEKILNVYTRILLNDRQ